MEKDTSSIKNCATYMKILCSSSLLGKYIRALVNIKHTQLLLLELTVCFIYVKTSSNMSA